MTEATAHLKKDWMETGHLANIKKCWYNKNNTIINFIPKMANTNSFSAAITIYRWNLCTAFRRCFRWMVDPLIVMLAHKMLFLLFKLLQVNIKILGWLATGRAAATCRPKSGPNSRMTPSAYRRRALHPKRAFGGTPKELFGSTKTQIFWSLGER